MFGMFSDEFFDLGEVRLRARVSDSSGAEPQVVVLLHGYPQSSSAWHAIAPALAERYRVICPDLRGYGESSKPLGSPDHANYSKRVMADDILAILDHIGIHSFAAVGHDRGARVAHRLALDHPDRVTKLSMIDIAPTVEMYDRMNADIASAYFHWSFLTQPAGVPENLLRGKEKDWVRGMLTAFGQAQFRDFDPDAQRDYEEAFLDPACLHGTCEDYRASATIDLRHDRENRVAGKGIECPTQIIWGESGILARQFDPEAVWKLYVNGSLETVVLPAGHFLPEEAPELLLSHLAPFLAS
ncbi:Haloacetate dehalogenase H-1 [Rhodococcus wratislaviensis]|uniref:Haloacetate dehalogenase H-1 n=2 Tax=Rhodococcus wratislaviensis TaxID=44752 RepID=A0A402CMR7_RHOWR|nr:Haloacetate dehalogenase H-1 [Rhodococcus wratislaviensis]